MKKTCTKKLPQEEFKRVSLPAAEYWIAYKKAGENKMKLADYLIFLIKLGSQSTAKKFKTPV